MPVRPVPELGQGPDLVLLHGVGAGPDTFVRLARLLAEDHRVLLPRRPGGPDGAVPLAEQVDAVADTIRGLTGGRVVVVGVSGGATLGLALALAHPGQVEALVLHEPLLGSHAPSLQRRFATAAAEAATDDASALAVVHAVLGERTWQRLAEADRQRIEAAAPWARLEIPLFAAFDPTDAELRALRAIPVLTTVGADSGADRREAAMALADLAGAEVVTLPGSGNAAQLDAPAALAAATRAWRRSPIGC